MTITLAQVESAAEEALSLVSQFAPLAALGGPAAGAIGVLVGQAGIPLDHLQSVVTEDGDELGRRCAVHRKVGRGGMAEVVEPKIGDA